MQIVSVSWQGWQQPPPRKFCAVEKMSENLVPVRKFSSKNAKFWVENPHL